MDKSKEEKIKDMKDKFKEIENEMDRFVETSKNIGMDADTVKTILEELIKNRNDYKANSLAIQKMIAEKLSIDDVIAIKNYNKQNKDE